MHQVQIGGNNQSIGTQRFMFNGEQLTDGEILQYLQERLSKVFGEDKAEEMLQDVRAKLSRKIEQIDE